MSEILSPSDTESEMNGEQAADFDYLNSLYVLFDSAIAQHLNPVIARLEQDITISKLEHIDRDRLLNMTNIKERLTHLTTHRWIKTYRDMIASLHQSVLHSDARGRREAILAVWLSDNVLTIDEEARRYERGDGDGARDPHLKTMLDRVIAQLDATTKAILMVLQVELTGEYRAIVPYKPELYELRYNRNIVEGQPVKIVVRGARFLQSENILIKPTVQPIFQR